MLTGPDNYLCEGDPIRHIPVDLHTEYGMSVKNAGVEVDCRASTEMFLSGHEDYLRCETYMAIPTDRYFCCDTLLYDIEQ